MHPSKPESAKNGFVNVAERLWRHKQTDVYYAFIKKSGKQFRRSLKTTDRQLASRRLADLLAEFARLMPSEAANLTFKQASDRWLENTRHTIKESSHDRRRRSVAAVAPFLSGIPIKNVRPSHCEAWLTQRGGTIAAQTFAHELNAMRAVFAYAMEQGWVLRNPASGIKRRRIVSKEAPVPTREQLQSIVAAIRAEPRERGGADLVELLAYSGMRLREATALRWRDVDFTAGVFTVTGGEAGTKNYEQRTVPLTEEMRGLLETIKSAREVTPGDKVICVACALKTLGTTCRRLELPKFHHHSLRHFFTTRAVEGGVDIPTIARWLGHKDGGALLMKRYAHLQQAHSLEQIKRVSLKPQPTE